MKWIISNDHRPTIEGFYFTEDSEGARLANASSIHFTIGLFVSECQWLTSMPAQLLLRYLID